MVQFRRPSGKYKIKTSQNDFKQIRFDTVVTDISGGTKNERKKSRTKQRVPTEESRANNTSDIIGNVLSMNDVLDIVISFLSPKQRHRSCILVSKSWRQVVMHGSQHPLSLRIDDTMHGETEKKWCSYHGDEDLKETFRYPLYAIGRLPSWIAVKTTKLVIVLRFCKRYASRYNLDDFLFYQGRASWFLDRFQNLQELTIFSEFASDQFVSILSPPSTIERQHSGIPSLKRIQYEETNVSNWRNSYLKSFVELAPNLEFLQVRENMRWKWKEQQNIFFQAEDIDDLLPLAGSLRELVLFNRPNLCGNYERFLERMPLLKSWDIYNSLLNMGGYPITSGRTPQNFNDNGHRWVNLNEHPHFVHYARDEAEFILTMQVILVPWFIGLNDPNIHPWNDKIVHMIGYLDAIMQEYFETEEQFFENRPHRPYKLPTLSNLLLEVDTTSVVSIDSSLTGNRKLGCYSSASKNNTRLKNYHRVFMPCMELYYNEFLYYCDSYSYGGGYSHFRQFRQRWQLKRLIKQISSVDDRYRRKKNPWLRKTKSNDFSVLV